MFNLKGSRVGTVEQCLRLDSVNPGPVGPLGSDKTMKQCLFKTSEGTAGLWASREFNSILSKIFLSPEYKVQLDQGTPPNWGPIGSLESFWDTPEHCQALLQHCRSSAKLPRAVLNFGQKGQKVKRIPPMDKSDPVKSSLGPVWPLWTGKRRCSSAIRDNMKALQACEPQRVQLYT